MTTLTDAMHADLKRDLARACDFAKLAIDRKIDRTSVYPLATQTQTFTFSIQPPGETLRQFTFTATLAEVSTPVGGNTTPGWADT